MINKYPGIKLISLIIAYDNNFIDRNTSEEEWLKRLDPIIGATGVDESDLDVLNSWCESLSREQEHILGSGEQEDIHNLIQECPKPELCGLFEDIFTGA